MGDELVTERIRQLPTYRPDPPLSTLRRELDVDEVVRLSTNENLFGPSPRAVEAIRRAAADSLYYPDGGGTARMRRAIAEFHELPRCQIVTANGSNEVITLLVRTFGEAGHHNAVVFDHGFIVYELVCRAEGLEVRHVSTDRDFRLDTEAMLQRIDESTRFVFIANPNNPTGTYVSADELRSFLERLPADVIAVVDEAYVQYADADDYESALEMRSCHQQLMVLRTFSKAYALAGLRVGYGIGPRALIDLMYRVREPFTCNGIAQAAIPPALADDEHLQRTVQRTREARRHFTSALDELSTADVDYTPSQANFALVHLPCDAQPVAERMKLRGVLVRPMHGYGLENSLRIAIADRQRMQQCICALEESLAPSPAT